jgi:ribosomal protein S18 acetylase RimI-like enzyme
MVDRMAPDIRIASEDDAATLSQVASATFPLACPPGTDEGDIATFIATDLTAERFARHLADPMRTILLATDDDEPTAYSMLLLGEPDDEDVQACLTARPSVELNKFYVVPKAHGNGLASRLMDASIEVARANGASGVWLGVSSGNPRANRFYEKHGFRVVGIKSFSMGEHTFDDDHVRERVL